MSGVTAEQRANGLEALARLRSGWGIAFTWHVVAVLLLVRCLTPEPHGEGAHGVLARDRVQQRGVALGELVLDGDVAAQDPRLSLSGLALGHSQALAGLLGLGLLRLLDRRQFVGGGLVVLRAALPLPSLRLPVDLDRWRLLALVTLCRGSGLGCGVGGDRGGVGHGVLPFRVCL